ncbi:MAG: prepilin-type N-terminal cleavage/methylation domain-containing protein [Betaproteobacteria bacterium]
MRRTRRRGFTLIELLVVLAIIGTLLTIALPKYLHSVARSREAVLHQDLRVMRTAIDQFLADSGRYPASLDELVERRYLRSLPDDPVTESARTWVAVAPPQELGATGVYDVRSGARGESLEGTPYEQW